jgi:hypothetical protein
MLPNAITTSRWMLATVEPVLGPKPAPSMPGLWAGLAFAVIVFVVFVAINFGDFPGHWVPGRRVDCHAPDRPSRRTIARRRGAADRLRERIHDERFRCQDRRCRPQ